jgi:ribosomal protein L44E
MKVFRGKSTEFYCGHCNRWISLQTVRKIPRQVRPAVFTDGKTTKDFKRVYECPKCGGIVLRSK